MLCNIVARVTKKKQDVTDPEQQWSNYDRNHKSLLVLTDILSLHTFEPEEFVYLLTLYFPHKFKIENFLFNLSLDLICTHFSFHQSRWNMLEELLCFIL